MWIVGDIDDECGMAILQGLAAPDNDAVTIHINSSGGKLCWTFAICAAIAASRRHVTTIVEGRAMSGACLIAMCGDTRQCAFGSEYLWHGCICQSDGTAIDNAASVRSQEATDDAIVALSAAHSKKSAGYWREVLAKNTDYWLTADDALAFGLVDEIVGIPKKMP
jgi:ATP-dependent protease ClpP protease subunit